MKNRSPVCGSPMQMGVGVAHQLVGRLVTASIDSGVSARSASRNGGIDRHTSMTDWHRAVASAAAAAGLPPASPDARHVRLHIRIRIDSESPPPGLRRRCTMASIDPSPATSPWIAYDPRLGRCGPTRTRLPLPAAPAQPVSARTSSSPFISSTPTTTFAACSDASPT